MRYLDNCVYYFIDHILGSSISIIRSFVALSIATCIHHLLSVTLVHASSFLLYIVGMILGYPSDVSAEVSVST